jgi:hypothetical protein
LDVLAQATESLFDYLTDCLLANHFFGDDIQLIGFYERSGRLHVITTQPYIDGIHPVWRDLVSGLESQGMLHENRLSKIPNFIFDGGPACQMTVMDLHENNVIQSRESRRFHPIDSHFYFDDRAERVAALKSLGLY